MYKYIIIGVILSALTWNAKAQDRKALATEITNKMSFMKKGHEKRQIEFLDSIYGTPFINLVSPKNISKDSLRHLLVDNGFCDFNFDLFNFKIAKVDDLNEISIKDKNPQLLKFLSDSTFNRVTYSFQKYADGINIFLILSKNDIVVDKVKWMFDGFMPGAEIHTVTFKAYSIKTAIRGIE